MDKCLAAKIKDNDSSAFKELYYRYFNAVLFYANQYLFNEEEAKDVAQDTFVSLWNSRKTLDYEQNIRAFIFTIARNKCLNILRTRLNKRKYHSTIQRRDAELSYMVLKDESAERAICNEVEQLVNEALSELPEQYRNVFEMNRARGMTYSEIAKELNLSVKTIEVRMMRVLQVLRRKLKDYIVFIPIFIIIQHYL